MPINVAGLPVSATGILLICVITILEVITKLDNDHIRGAVGMKGYV